jgi:hypothetical protein
MFGGSRPKRALTIRATCPAGTIGHVGAAAVEAARGAACGGGSGGLWRRSSCKGRGVGGASTPDDRPAASEFWLGPIDPGGRGIASKPGGLPLRQARAKRRTPAAAPP